MGFHRGYELRYKTNPKILEALKRGYIIYLRSNPCVFKMKARSFQARTYACVVGTPQRKTAVEGTGSFHTWAGSCTTLGYITRMRQCHRYLLATRNNLTMIKSPGMWRATKSFTCQPWWTISAMFIQNTSMHPPSAGNRSLHYQVKTK